ncbi:MAG: UDP-N-acetylglucosamine--N-acetylmuramyl-(pentapeptide) pyrophosphoryl-undecaprenol N-acetylglucosamine transferase [Holosporales bacterium]|jgi:UDP-N-acetylglucosamine--N-acetylmuramyl-(pentapeptide) pyrophosphoryl-undecaprenol N-acetylglucosamine transferase|nr:UDP-N-acetylglucosamine--N-acetylmuramyl-(pentapeptide) pyrophosphoryl-undecaprenol N-acetylglucosamine transferase [Holosporales bacterium]
MHADVSCLGRIILCAAGTGGHIFPALSVYTALKGEDPLLVTDSRGAVYCENMRYDEKLVLDAGQESLISVKGICFSLFKFFRNIHYLFTLWRQERPNVVVGFGGCATLAPLLLARLMRIPTLIHEQNAVMGRTNRVLSYIVTRIALSFPETRKCPRLGKRQHTGMPIRAEFIGHPLEPLKKQGNIRLCVLGGSQGAHVLSSIVPRALILLPEALRKRLFVVQQVQEDDLPFVEAFYTLHSISHELFRFTDRPVDAIKGAHLVICRAGASSLAELAALGRPALMVPYPYALDGHQKENARFYTSHRAGWCILERDFSPQSCADFLKEHLEEISVLENAGKAMHTLAETNAAEALVSAIVELKRR